MTLIIQLAPFALLIAGALASASFYVSLKKELQALANQLQEQHRGMSNFEERVGAQLEEMRTLVREANERAGVLVPPTPPRSGFNLSKRSQVLRMSRLGERPENIAVALSLPKKEVELLLKVQKIVLTSAASAGAATS